MSIQYTQLVIGPTAVVAADTEADWYLPFLLPGKWLIKSVKVIPDAAVTANGTNYAVFTVTNATQSTTIGTRSWAATDSVAGTAETVTTPTGLAAVLTEGDTIKLAKTDPGTGLAIRARVVIFAERYPLP